MPGKKIAFECLRCGTCCTGLLVEDMEVLRGLTLLPDEEKEQALADNQFSPDIEEAFAEIGAVIAEVVSEVFYRFSVH